MVTEHIVTHFLHVRRLGSSPMLPWYLERHFSVQILRHNLNLRVAVVSNADSRIRTSPSNKSSLIDEFL